MTAASNATATITIMASSQSSVERFSGVGGMEVVVVGSGQEDLWKFTMKVRLLWNLACSRAFLLGVASLMMIV